MLKKITIEKKGKTLCTVSTENDKVVASLKTKEWETTFFRRKFGILRINHNLLLTLGDKTNHHILDSLLAFADENGFNLLEFQCDVSAIELIPIIEQKNFCLVDIRVTFITLILKPISEKYSFDRREMTLARKSDLQEILHLTHKSFTHNPSFFSRFKNKKYFTQEETKRYYSAWIENHLGNDNTLFAVLKRKERIIGYCIFRLVGRYQGKPLYKEILVAVDPDYRGRKASLSLVSFLYDRVPEDQFYLDDTTNLTNFSALKNIIRQRRNLKRIELIFYRLKGGENI